MVEVLEFITRTGETLIPSWEALRWFFGGSFKANHNKSSSIDERRKQRSWKKRNVIKDLLWGRPNPRFILKSSYSHHVYMDNDVYNKQSTWDIIHSLLVHRHVPKFDEIPFFNENFSKWRYINCLLELEAYFYFNKILYYI